MVVQLLLVPLDGVNNSTAVLSCCAPTAFTPYARVEDLTCAMCLLVYSPTFFTLSLVCRFACFLSVHLEYLVTTATHDEVILGNSFYRTQHACMVALDLGGRGGGWLRIAPSKPYENTQCTHASSVCEDPVDINHFRRFFHRASYEVIWPFR